MFYCNDCGTKKGWPVDTILASNGLCEVCGKEALCNDVNARLLPAPPKRDEWIIVEEQAGAGSHYEVFPMGLEGGLMHHVYQLRRKGVNHRIYRLLELEQLEYVEATLRTKHPDDDPGLCMTGGACSICDKNDKEE